MSDREQNLQRAEREEQQQVGWHARDIFWRFASRDVPEAQRWDRARLLSAATGRHCLASRAEGARRVLAFVDAGFSAEHVWHLLGGDAAEALEVAWAEHRDWLDFVQG